MRISVIMPSYRMARFLPDAIASVQRQSRAVAEILVIDSGSDDGTGDVVRALAADGAPVRLIEDSQRGPGPARNLGIRQARGDVIAFLDGDDLYPAGKLDAQIARLEAGPHVDMVSGFVTYFDRLDTATLAPAADARTETLFHVHLGACLYRRAVFDRIGGFSDSLMYSEDVDLLLRVREAGVPFTILRRVTLYYRRHDNSMMTQSDPRKEGDFRRAVAMSLARRRARGRADQDLPPFETYLEPAA
jgi:glycosyltransferase involved in cell wall biosynthesis